MSDTAASTAVALATKDIAQTGDLVIIYLGPQALSPLVLKAGTVFDNKYGKFAHNDMIGKPFGHKVKSLNSEGFIHFLRPSPELWTLSLPHRTQIIYFIDIAVILLHLNVKSGQKVVESGTGSGSLTTSLARAVGPAGHVYTFEFNADRVEKAREDFLNQKLDKFVTVAHADACVDGFGAEKESSIDAVFLDLPQPWLAIPHAKHVMKRNGNICCFSPCIEQVQRNCETLKALGFEDIHTVEALGRYYEVQGGSLPAPAINFDTSKYYMSNANSTADMDEVATVGGVKRSRAEEAAGKAAKSARSEDSCSAGRNAITTATADGSNDDKMLATTKEAVGQSTLPNVTATAVTDRIVADLPEPFGRPLPASVHKPISCGVTQVVAARGHTSYLTFATLYRKT